MDSLQFQLQALNFRPWGFQRLRIDQQALATGTVTLSEASGILSDGLLFDIPESDAAPSPRSIADRFAQDQESLAIYLAIPHYREQGLNVANGIRDVEARYRAEVAMIRDDNTGQSERPVMMARKNFRLLVEGESQEGISVMQIAMVRKTPAGVFQSDPHFMAPMLDLNASDYLLSIARRLVEILSAKSSTLSGSRRQKNQSLADFTASDIANFWLLYTINTAFPTISHLFETRGGHPEALFSAMLQLAGSLTTFSQKVHPRDLPVYDHENLGGCFTELDEKLRFLLETVVPSNFVSLPLKLVQPNIYATSIDKDEYLRNTRMYLAVSRRHQPGRHHRTGPEPGQDLLRRPHRAAGAKGPGGRSADPFRQPAERHPAEAELSIFQPEPERRSVGDHRAGPQSGGVCARRFSEPAVGVDHSAAGGRGRAL